MFILLVLFCFPSAYFSFSDSSYTFHSRTIFHKPPLLRSSIGPSFPIILVGTLYNQAFLSQHLHKNEGH